MTPTRGFAVQVGESFKDYGRHVGLRTTVIYGGVPMPPQERDLLAGIKMIVATPGRLLDHAGSRTLNLGQVQILVLDEADRMLNMGFIDDIRRILALLPERRQNLLFSATLSADPLARGRVPPRPGPRSTSLRPSPPQNRSSTSRTSSTRIASATSSRT